MKKRVVLFAFMVIMLIIAVSVIMSHSPPNKIAPAAPNIKIKQNLKKGGEK